jgi:hypothetical protein
VPDPALAPGGHALVGTHVGDGDVVCTEAYGGVSVSWTTHLWQPQHLTATLATRGLRVVAEMRFPAEPASRPQVLLAAERPG